MARTFPTVGVSPIDVYNVDDRPCAYFEQVITLPDTTQVDAVKVVGTPTMIASSQYVGIESAVAPVGTSGAWAASIFAKMTQDSTKRITGYLCAGEFELNNSAPLASAMACLVLNWNNSATDAVGGNQAYIILRDYSSGTNVVNLFEMTDATIGSNVKTDLISTSTSDVTATHCVRFTVANVAYYFLVSSAGPA